MTLPGLVNHLLSGREIEFTLDSHNYFLAPLYLDGKFSGSYYIYDVKSQGTVFSGSLDDILSFEFVPSITLLTNISLFNFRYIM